jgi:hypothetical protein
MRISLDSREFDETVLVVGSGPAAQATAMICS